MTQRSDSNNPDFSEVKRGLVEFIETLDQLVRLADQHGGDCPDWAKAVTAVAREILAAPAISRLRGRVLEATHEEVRAALVTLATMTTANGEAWTNKMLQGTGQPDDVMASLRNSRDAFRGTGIHRN